MKKVFSAMAVLCVALLMTSCYTSQVYNGTMKPGTPAVQVNTKHNSHFLYGLIGQSKMRAKDYVEGEKNYMIKTQHTFLDYVLSYVSLGIYTPTTTKFYVPAKSTKSKKKSSRARDNEDEEDD